MNEMLQDVAFLLMMLASVICYFAAMLAFARGVIPFPFLAVFCGIACAASVLATIQFSEVK